MSLAVSTSLSRSAVTKELKTEKVTSSRTKAKSSTRMIVSSMRIERYYSSVREEVSLINDDALALLDNQDYIGFFKGCGSSYVRSIRRVQELTAIFKYKEASAEKAASFAKSIEVPPGSNSGTSSSELKKSKFNEANKSLTIKILGFGLGLGTSAQGTLLATSLAEYFKIMEFGFRAFTQGENAKSIGMVYGIETLPWVDNPHFQASSNVLDVDIEVPLPSSLIPKAFTKDRTVRIFVNDVDTRSLFRCKETAFHMDKFGYCCDGSWLLNITSSEYENEDQNIETSNFVCAPTRTLDKSVVKNNMSINAEFVSRLDSMVTHKMNQIFILENCVTALIGFPETFDDYLLKEQGYGRGVVRESSVLEMKIALNPTGDYSLIKFLGEEVEEWLDMYYQPCIAALFGTNIGSSPDVEPKFFMAYGWIQHDACAEFACLSDNMRWDRQNGGCVQGILNGRSSPLNSSNDNCKKDDNNECQYQSSDLSEFRDNVEDCWANGNIPFDFMNRFCMPVLTNNRIDVEDHETNQELARSCRV